jgi:hypothetical protein
VHVTDAPKDWRSGMRATLNQTAARRSSNLKFS